jgi:hypothetical protein
MESSTTSPAVDRRLSTPSVAADQPSPGSPEVRLGPSENADDRRAECSAMSVVGPSDGEDDGGNDNEGDEAEKRRRHQQRLKYPIFTDKAFFVLRQTSAPRSWCLALITWSYPLAADECIACERGMNRMWGYLSVQVFFVGELSAV